MRRLCLIVEDSSTQAMAIMRMVGSLGWDMLSAPSLKVACETLRNEQVNLILSDLMLPDSLDGNTVSALRAVQPEAMIAAMSAGGGGGGADARALLAKARAQGAAFMLPKPFSLERLAETLSEATRRIETGKRTEHVLVVDDSSTVRMICERALKAAGLRVSLASSLDEAIDNLDILDLDTLVSDVHMPGSDVIELLPELRAALPGVGLVVMTGMQESSAGDLRRALAAGAHGTLAKPFKPDELVSVVRKAGLLASSELLAGMAA
jgi:CheY-like chemotaxis protein